MLILVRGEQEKYFLRLVFTSDGVGVRVVTRSVKRYDLVKNQTDGVGSRTMIPDPVYAGGEILDYLSDCCEQVLSSDPDARIVIAGDINQLDINTLMSQHNFQQLVKSFTRGQKILDVFLTNCPHLWKLTSVFKSLVRSDHLSILVMPRIVVKPFRKTVSFRDVREHRKLCMDKKMDQFDWERFTISDDPSDNVRRLSEILSLIV